MDNKKEAQQAARQEINRSSLKTYHASALLSLPVVYITYLVVNERFSTNISLPIVLGVFIVSSMIIMRLIRNWLYKKPPTSSWFNWLD